MVIFLSGDPTWPEGWVFSAWFILLCYTVIIYLSRVDPKLLEERYKQPGSGNEEGWDRYVVFGLVVGFAAWIVIMPLDARRYSWSPQFPLWLETIGLLMLIGSFFLFFRSYADNTYLSPLVRLQEERKQRVVSTGVYGFVRHPMYLGAILMVFGTPLLLGSVLGTVVGMALTAILMVRIVGEEKMLSQGLEGYSEYVKKVRYHLFPFLW
jgi:protein-S-isoprenylcysteine O-methyltransferase Ste14